MSFQMDNQNKKEYLDAIKALTLDNLRYLPHAPSVQMQTVPPDTLSFEDYGEQDDLGQGVSDFQEKSSFIVSAP